VHGLKDRVKDASPNDMRRSLVRVLGAYALWRMLTNVPLLGALLDIRCHRRVIL
jgi:hypothetical protein